MDNPPPTQAHIHPLSGEAHPHVLLHLQQNPLVLFSYGQSGAVDSLVDLLPLLGLEGVQPFPCITHPAGKGDKSEERLWRRASFLQHKDCSWKLCTRGQLCYAPCFPFTPNATFPLTFHKSTKIHTALNHYTKLKTHTTPNLRHRPKSPTGSFINTL